MIPFTRTVGYRLWLICVAAIVIPLGINIVLLNIRQYTTIVRNAVSAFEENARLKASTLSQLVPLNIDALTLVSEVLDLELGIPSQPNVELSQEMERIFATTYDEISLLKKENNDYIVIASSTPEHLGENYRDRVHISEESAFAATLRQSVKSHEMFSVTQSHIFDSQSHEILGLLYTTFNTEQLLNSLLIPSKDYLSIKTAILSHDGIILKASDPSLSLHPTSPITEDAICEIFLQDAECPRGLLGSIIKLSPLPSHPGSYSFTIKNREAWGHLTPIPNMNLYVLSYSLTKDIFGPLWQRSILYVAYFICILLGSSVAYLVAKRLSQPIRQLATVMFEIRNQTRQTYIDDSMGFEINRLGQIFNTMVQNLTKQEALAKKHHEIKEKAQNVLRLGEQAQQRLLPNTLPNYPNTSLAKAYIPAITVGGDFFDAFVTEHKGKRKLFLIVADASGKGVNACGYSLFLKHMLRTLLSENLPIQEVIQQAAFLFYQNTASSGMFVTLCVYSYDYVDNIMEFYSCGHNPACYLAPSGSVTLLSHQGMALGFLPEVPNLPTATFQPEPGSLIILYSDGITEAHNKNFDMFGEERLKSVLATLAGRSAEDVLNALMMAIKSFVRDCEQHDDITLLILKILET